MPPLLRDLAKFVEYMPEFQWRRVRFAVTRKELEEIKQYVSEVSAKDQVRFFYAVRGVPSILEDDPTHPEITMELF